MQLGKYWSKEESPHFLTFSTTPTPFPALSSSSSTKNPCFSLHKLFSPSKLFQTSMPIFLQFLQPERISKNPTFHSPSFSSSIPFPMRPFLPPKSAIKYSRVLSLNFDYSQLLFSAILSVCPPDCKLFPLLFLAMPHSLQEPTRD